MTATERAAVVAALRLIERAEGEAESAARMAADWQAEADARRAAGNARAAISRLRNLLAGVAE